MSLYFHHCDAGSTKLYVLIFGRENIRDGVEILANQLTENAVALAVKDAYMSHAYKDGVVNEILHCGESFVATHSSYVDVLMEIGTSIVDGLACSARSSSVSGGRGGHCLWRFSVLQSVGAHLCPHISEDDGSHLSVCVHRLYVAYRLRSLYSDGVLLLEKGGCWLLVVGCRLRVGISR